ncbi:16S rRNA (guanine(527)-N(7))-methyltransferase RsmG [Corynebacterium flavescens]|uniref:16S rRNA (guanine(527)-N(7))-methyltransferase RsmG n=1 Tax=Corynebacterium flavescens TaxID=28028 RepID=UPI002647E37B|nr:16S rRNA (guanine(527)-N(7))-methyltransferase RsmG [Corynebacterium flavescens]MDN6431816.1 16S rRNA (guanine(527)-N(7))-methyltransferase RsmG [Corynebacterium flavescens]MDN6460574.1 16S rRNA (guanine(527)-N(7))-methyltransferase RsmG [Corynebacterium flavescens]MDN6475632.1 16S rRNA (guanine(527)-N(7))-methyltransferase RsmG [Corynebacterium flavescens]MDN6601715.1 16S rRNA (guanine(527)-N(7))-methyltransferase RsmG [Corynebacterium flavescens]MDN6824031.1 16S rRNA (guanine(527)-N(7))-m
MSVLDPSEVFGPRLAVAQAYHDSLATDGSIRGFIGPREVPRLWERHILNCAVVNSVIPTGARVVDVGSGAGLPGIPLAIARPDLQLTLVEPLLKRSNYLSEVVELLGLDNVTVIRGRAEEGPVKKVVAGADVVTSRAVAPLGKLAKWSLPLVRKGGEMIALKGSSVLEELERDAAEIKRAGGGKAQVETIEGTTIIRVPRVN